MIKVRTCPSGWDYDLYTFLSCVGDAAEGGEDEGGEGEGGDEVQMLTMVLMTIDGEIKTLYNDILGELESEARMKLAEELQDLKVKCAKTSAPVQPYNFIPWCSL